LVLLEAFLEATDEAVFSHDDSGRVTSWNRGAQRIFGYLREEVLGRPSTILVPEHLRADAKLVFDTVMAGDIVDHFETEAVRKDGLPIVISVSVRPVFDADGHVAASALVARDITEQRLAQATLAEIDNHEREREALAHVGSWLWDLRTGAVQWSDELHRIHGVDPLDFEGTLEAHLGRVHPEDEVRVRAGMEQAVASGGPFEDEYRIVRPGGELRWVLSRAEPTIGSAGVVVGLRGIGQDVTDRRSA
jgi:PAS domain S-box-containing protein